MSLASLYLLIFSYIGITIIRKAFLDQEYKLWITEIPNAYRIEEYEYMINYSRLKGDLYTEEIFYNELLDLFRNLDKIKDITGPIVNPHMLKNK